MSLQLRLVIAVIATVTLLAPALLAAQTGTTVFRHVSVIPMDEERVLENQRVVVRDGRIAAVEAESGAPLPADAVVVDGTGRFLIPGYAEMHAHIPTPQAGREAVDRTLYLYLAAGVTTIRGMLGHPSHLDLRDRSRRNEILAPRIYTSGPSFSGNSAPDPETARAMVRDQAGAGYDFLKLHPGLSRPVFDAIIAAAEEAGLRVAGHVSAEVGLGPALAAGYASIDHLDGYVEALAGHRDGFSAEEAGFFGFDLTAEADPSLIPELARATHEAGVWNVPTESLMRHLASPTPPEEMAEWPEMRYMPPGVVENWVQRKRAFQSADGFTPERAARYIELRAALIRGLHEAGAGMALGSDAPQWWNVPGFSARRELEYMVDAGLSPFQALAMGTRDAARFFGAEGEWGTIAPSLHADLVLLDADPLADIGALWQQAGVMVRGRWLPRAELQHRLDEIEIEVRR